MEHFSLSRWAGEEKIYASDHEMYDIDKYAVVLKQEQPSSRRTASLSPDTLQPAELKQGRLILEGKNKHNEDVEAIQEANLDEKRIYNLNQIHMHDDFVELFYVLSGSGVAFFNDTKRMIQRGDLVCVHVGESHTNYPLPQVKVCNCLIATSLITPKGPLFHKAVQGPGRLNLDTFNRLSGNTLMEVENLFQLLLRESTEQLPYYQESLLNYVNQLFICLCRFREENKTQLHYHRTMSPILDYVAANYRTVTLTELAQFSSYNPTYLSKLFHETLGLNFTEYVNRLRIDEAVKLTLQSDMPIDEICQHVGFKSRLHFYEVFKKHTGFTPGALRKR